MSDNTESSNQEVDDKQRKINERKQKLFNLKLKMNAGRVANSKEIEAEYKRVVEKKKVNTYEEEKKEEKETIPEEKKHLYENAAIADSKAYKNKQKEQNKKLKGWEIFTNDALYKGHQKREKEMMQKFKPVIKEDAETIPTENLDNLVKELEHQEEKRNKYSRRRAHHDDEDVDYINERNHVFNKKLKRAFDSYTGEIKANIERGTAL